MRSTRNSSHLSRRWNWAKKCNVGFRVQKKDLKIKIDFLLIFLILISDLDFHRLINQREEEKKKKKILSFFRYYYLFYFFLFLCCFFFFCLLTASLRALIVAQVVSLSLSRHDFVCSSLSLSLISSLISLLVLVFLFYISLIPIIIFHSYIDLL